MKNPLYLKIALGALALIILIVLIWGIGANHKLFKLEANYNTSVGKNIIYEMDAKQLKGSITSLNTTFFLYKKKLDSLTKSYVSILNERDEIIKRYRQEHQSIANLSSIGSIRYFNAKLGDTHPSIIVSVSPDTTFGVPDYNIKKANELFIERDEYKETNDNLKKSEGNLLKINENLKLEISNRQSTVDKLTELVNNKDAQIAGYQQQVKDLNAINRKQKRKDIFHKIGIGAAGILGIILAITYL